MAHPYAQHKDYPVNPGWYCLGFDRLDDKSIQARSGHVVVAVIDGEFVCKTLSIRAGRLKLKAANPCHSDIVPKDSQCVEIWGVVIHAIKSMPI